MKIKNIIAGTTLGALLIVPGVAVLAAHGAAPNWNTSGSYVVAMNYLGTDYYHDVVLEQDMAGTLTGSGGSPAGANTYAWTVTSGAISGDAISLTADYTATADAVTPLTTMHLNGTIAIDGTMSGTWSDNYQGGSRSGTWRSTVGSATMIDQPTLAAEDFGVVNYDTGLGHLKGYSAGFGLTNATFEDVQSVVVKLYAGDTLLQTNTATAKLGAEIAGTQISSPFDVSGNFQYGTDGYWTNVRENQYGQSVAATRVVATVTLEDGTVVTATNTVLTGDPTTIYPVVSPPDTGNSDKDACKKGGWKNFTNPSYKNQGQCVSAHAKR